MGGAWAEILLDVPAGSTQSTPRVQAQGGDFATRPELGPATPVYAPGPRLLGQHHDRIVGCGLLQLKRLSRRRLEPLLGLFRRPDQHRHRLGVDRLDDAVGPRRQNL